MDQFHHMGKGMLLMAWVLGLVLLTLMFGEWEEKQVNPNQQPESSLQGRTVQVVLNRNRWGHYVVNGTINEQAAVFLLDTGATDVVIPETIANRLGLSRGMPLQASTANGLITVYQTRLDSLTIGDIHLRQVSASINPAMNDHDEILLGMSALKSIEFSQENNKMILRQHNP